MRLRVEWEPRDLWLGIYWTWDLDEPTRWTRWRIYLCLLPTVPIIFEWWTWRACPPDRPRSREEGP